MRTVARGERRREMTSGGINYGGCVNQMYCVKNTVVYFLDKCPALSIGEIIGACVGPKARLIELEITENYDILCK